MHLRVQSSDAFFAHAAETALRRIINKLCSGWRLTALVNTGVHRIYRLTRPYSVKLLILLVQLCGDDEILVYKCWTGILTYLFFMSTTGYELNAKKQLAGLAAKLLQRLLNLREGPAHPTFSRPLVPVVSTRLPAARGM